MFFLGYSEIPVVVDMFFIWIDEPFLFPRLKLHLINTFNSSISKHAVVLRQRKLNFKTRRELEAAWLRFVPYMHSGDLLKGIYLAFSVLLSILA